MKLGRSDAEIETRTLDLSERAIAARKAFLEFEDADVERLRQLHLLLRDHAPGFADAFYDHILAFDETRALLSDPAALERLRRAQAAYFESLTAGEYGGDYVRHRLRVGMVHERVGLSPRWYLGAYSKYLVTLLPEIEERLDFGREAFLATVQSLIKIVLFDMGLAIDTYIQARDQTILGLRNYAEMVFDSMRDAIIVVSPELIVLSANRTCVDMFGLAPERILGTALSELFVGAELEGQAAAVVESGIEVLDFPLVVEVAGSGLRKNVRLTLKSILPGSEQRGVLMVMEELSGEEIVRRDAEARLARSEAMLRHAQSVGKIGSWRVAAADDLELLEWSDETYRLFAIPVGTPVRYSDFISRVHAEDRARVTAAWEAALGGERYHVEHRIEAGGATLWVEERAEIEFGPDGEFVSVTGTVQDITARKLDEGRIEQLAFYDGLTALPNRALFHDRLQQALGLAQRQKHSIAVLFVDLDRFKEINDTQGHACGDEVLIEIARRFRGALRHEETLARLGGDEFVIIAHETGRSGATLIAERLKRVLAKPVSVKGSAFTLGASVGIAMYPHDGTDSESLLKHADIAMYRAKANGGSYCFYDADMGAELARRLEVAQRFTRALEDNRLRLHYQPQVRLGDGEMIGAEALLRWHDPEWGWVSPAEFIPIAEERGMMNVLGDWVLNEACRQLQQWTAAGLELPQRLAINVAAQQIEQHDFDRRALAIATKAGISPTRIELEITESSMMLDPDCAMRVTQALSRAGFAFAIDDFGTGHSSLAYLKRFPAGTLKIDRSFVHQMLRDRNDLSIVTTIIAMAHGLGLKTLAEGVEEQGQVDKLLALGCGEAQGYHFGYPVDADAFAARWLKPAALPAR